MALLYHSCRPTLKFDLILNDKWLSFGRNWLVEFGGNSVMSGLVLDDETFIANHSIEDRWLFDGPVADIGPFFFGTCSLLLLCVGWFPPGIPIICELF